MKNLLIILAVLFFSSGAYAKCPLGEMFYDRGNLPYASSSYNECAYKGDIKSQYMMGSMYYLGRGTEKDFKQAIFYYQMAAENGFAPAQVKLALLFWRGEGVEQPDLVKAMKWLILAADGRDRKWFYPAMENGLSAENEDGKALEYLKKVSALLNEEQRNEAYRLASEVKFRRLQEKAQKILNQEEYDSFMNRISQNANDRKKIDAIIMDLYKISLNRKRNG